MGVETRPTRESRDGAKPLETVLQQALCLLGCSADKPVGLHQRNSRQARQGPCARIELDGTLLTAPVLRSASAAPPTLESGAVHLSTATRPRPPKHRRRPSRGRPARAHNSCRKWEAGSREGSRHADQVPCASIFTNSARPADPAQRHAPSPALTSVPASLRAIDNGIDSLIATFPSAAMLLA